MGFPTPPFAEALIFRYFLITKNDETSWHGCFDRQPYCIACNSQSLLYLAVALNFLLAVGPVFVNSP